MPLQRRWRGERWRQRIWRWATCWTFTARGARDAIKHGETTLLELEQKVGFAVRYRRVQQTLEELEQLVIDARFECTGPHARLTTGEYVRTLNKILALLRSIDEVNES